MLIAAFGGSFMEEKAKHIPVAIEKPKLIPKKLLSSDESLIFESRKGWWSCMKWATLALLVALATSITLVLELTPSTQDLPYVSTALGWTGGGGAQVAMDVVAVIAIIVLSWFFYLRWMRRTKTVYAITDERVILRKQMLTKDYQDIPLTKIENIEVRQRLRDRVFGLGRLDFMTESPNDARMIWEGVPRPMAVRTMLQEVMDIRQKPNREAAKH
jgi:uncharacterized membrane protein YdbT with pleckstrin-like domain